MTPAEVGCPEWCEEMGEHETHRRQLSAMIATSGARHERIQLGLILPPHRRRARIEMIIYRGMTEVMRFDLSAFSADDIAAELITSALAVRQLNQPPPR